MTKMTENEVIKAFIKQYAFRSSYKFFIPNCYYLPDNEADIFCIKPSLFTAEYEVKLTKADFFNDAKKQVIYEGMSEQKHSLLENGKLKPNYFTYIIKEGIVDISDIPDFAGVYEAYEKKGSILFRCIRKPKRLHRNKITSEQLIKYLYKMAYRYMDTLR